MARQVQQPKVKDKETTACSKSEIAISLIVISWI
jgi:hypothetical protein